MHPHYETSRKVIHLTTSSENRLRHRNRRRHRHRLSIIHFTFMFILSICLRVPGTYGRCKLDQKEHVMQWQNRERDYDSMLQTSERRCLYGGFRIHRVGTIWILNSFTWCFQKRHSQFLGYGRESVTSWHQIRPSPIRHYTGNIYVARLLTGSLVPHNGHPMSCFAWGFYPEKQPQRPEGLRPRTSRLHRPICRGDSDQVSKKLRIDRCAINSIPPLYVFFTSSRTLDVCRSISGIINSENCQNLIDVDPHLRGWVLRYKLDFSNK